MKAMKAMILAAGLGNRMRPLTLHTPKPLLPVADKPLIVWHIEKLQAIGVTEIVINTAWLGEKLATALGDGSQFGVNILWSHEGEGLETAGGIINALPLLGAEPFILVNGDVWCDMNFADFLKIDLQNDLAHLLLVPNPPQHPQGDFVYAKERAYSFEQAKALDIDGTAYTYSGLAVLSPQLLANLPSGKRPLAPLLLEAMQQQRVQASIMHKSWVDVGTPERLQALDHQLRLQKST